MREKKFYKKNLINDIEVEEDLNVILKIIMMK